MLCTAGAGRLGVGTTVAANAARANERLLLARPSTAPAAPLVEAWPCCCCCCWFCCCCCAAGGCCTTVAEPPPPLAPTAMVCDSSSGTVEAMSAGARADRRRWTAWGRGGAGGKRSGGGGGAPAGFVVGSRHCCGVNERRNEGARSSRATLERQRAAQKCACLLAPVYHRSRPGPHPSKPEERRGSLASIWHPLDTPLAPQQPSQPLAHLPRATQQWRPPGRALGPR